MRKKYLNALLFGALVVASTGTFTSCKDYDDDIDQVQTNLDTKTGDLSKQLQELKAKVEQAGKDADANLAKAKEELNNALKGKADQAAVDALNKSLEAYKAQADKLGKQLGELQALVNTNKTLAETANANLKSELQKEIDGIKTSLSGYLTTADAAKLYQTKEEAKTAKETADKARKELGDKITALEKTVKANGETLGSLSDELAKFKTTVEETYATKADLNKSIEGLKVSLEAEITAAQAEAIAKAQAKVEAAEAKLTDAIATAKTEAIAEAQKKVDAAKKELTDAIAAAKSEAIAEAQKKVDAAKKDLTDAIATAKTEAIAAAETKVNTAKAELETEIDKAKLSAREELALGIKMLFEALDKKVDVTTFKTTVKDFEDRITALEADPTTKTALTNAIASLKSELLKVIGGRLTSLHFVPDEYINGVKVLRINSYTFQNWPNGDFVDSPLAGKDNVVSFTRVGKNGEQLIQATFMVNPSNVSLDGVTFDIVAKDGVKNITRAITTGEDAPLKVIDKKFDPATGVLVVTFSKADNKAGNQDLGSSEDSFTNIMLRATLKPLKEGESSSYVFSDFVRIVEKTVTPHLHNTSGNVTNDNRWLYTWSDLKKTGKNDKVLKEFPADKDVVLKTLVNAISFEGTQPVFKDIIDTETKDRQFKLEFKLVKYEQSGEGVDGKGESDQSSYATLETNKDGFTVLRAKSVGNSSALGHEPMVQVRLVANNGKIADVRYFKIKWGVGETVLDKDLYVDTKSSINVKNCDKPITVKVPAQNINKLFVDVYNTLGLTKSQFLSQYELYSSVGQTVIEKEDGTLDVNANFNEVLGKLTANADYSQVEWTFDPNTVPEIFKPSNKELNDHKIIKEAVFTFVPKVHTWENRNSMVQFTLKAEIAISQMSAIPHYIPYWNNEGQQIVNPMLMTDAEYGTKGSVTHNSTVILSSDLTVGYNAELAKLVKGSDPSKNKFVFVKFGKYTPSADGLELTSKLGKVASFDGTRVTLAEENGKPTKAAQDLMNNGGVLKVALVGSYCLVKDQKVEEFEVRFLQPLSMKISDKERSVLDLTTDANKQTISIEGLVTVSEAFKKEGNEVLDTKNKPLCDWYGFTGVTFDIDNAVVNIVKDKNGKYTFVDKIDKTCMKLKDIKRGLEYERDGQNNITAIKYLNAQGATLDRDIKVRVYVDAKSKWQPKLSDGSKDYFEFTVKANYNK